LSSQRHDWGLGLKTVKNGNLLNETVKKKTLRILLLLFFVGSVAVGFLDREYEIVRSFVRTICAACLGLG